MMTTKKYDNSCGGNEHMVISRCWLTSVVDASSLSVVIFFFLWEGTIKGCREQCAEGIDKSPAGRSQARVGSKRSWDMFPGNLTQMGKFGWWHVLPINFFSVLSNHEHAWIKTSSGGVCCHNAQGHMGNSKSNPKGVRLRDRTHCSHKPECIVTINPDRSVLIMITTWHFQFHPVDVSISLLKGEARVIFTWYSHCYVTWCPLRTGIVTSQYPLSRNARS